MALACQGGKERPLAFAGAPVILISIDTLRADHLPAYGYSGVSTPALDGFRRDAVLFRHAYSQCPMTLPAHVSIVTGLLPFEHGVRDNVGFTFDAKRFPSVPTMLKRSGYATGAAVSSFVLRGETGLAPAFDWFDDAVDPRASLSFRDLQRPGDATVASAQRWIEPRAANPFFFFLHLYEPHVPYEPAEPFRTQYAANPYDGEIATADAITGRFLDWLKQKGIYDRAIIVVTSDHGEGLGDHGEQQHSILIHNELIHVPLMVKLPESQRAGTTVDAVVQIADIAPTLASLAGVAAPALKYSTSLFAADDPNRSAYSESLYARLHLGWSELRSLVRGPNHYIEAPRPELYDVRTDPAEKNDVASSDRRTLSEMKSAMSAYPVTAAVPQTVDEETARNLTALGYLAGSSTSQTSGPLPNPHERIADFEKLRGALQAIAAGRDAEGRRTFDEVANANPRMSEAWVQLAETYTRAGRLDDALAAYKQALARGGATDETLLGTADVQLQRGNAGEAAQLASSVRTRTRRGQTLLARAAIAQRDLATAEQHATALAESAGALPSDMLLLADVRLRQGDAAGAEQWIARAESLARERGDSSVFRSNYLRGEIHMVREQPREAIAAYEREIAQYPENLLAYSHLAVVHVVTGNRPGAESTLRKMVAANPGRAAEVMAENTRKALAQ